MVPYTHITYNDGPKLSFHSSTENTHLNQTELWLSQQFVKKNASLAY